jgi:hypothetical protein
MSTPISKMRRQTFVDWHPVRSSHQINPWKIHLLAPHEDGHDKFTGARTEPCVSDRLWVPLPTCVSKVASVRRRSPLDLSPFPFLSICCRFDKNKKYKIFDKKILNTKLAQENFRTKSLRIQKSLCKNFSKKLEEMFWRTFCGKVLKEILWKEF